MNAITPFAFGDHAVRITDRDGQPWFVLADVCRVLDLANVGNAAARLKATERADIRLADATGREQLTAVVNEAGLYRLIMRSRKPAAEAFSDWVTGDVLPSIRRTGSYGAPANALDLRDPEVLHRLLLDHTGQTMAARVRLADLAPKAAALERLTSAAAGSLAPTHAAKVNRPAIVREAELSRILRAAKKAGVHVLTEFKPDGAISIATTSAPAVGLPSSLADEMFG